MTAELSPDDLLIPFTESCKPRSEFRIGMEAEKFGITQRGLALSYDQPDENGASVVAVLEGLSREFGWKTRPERPGGPLIALERDGASITLEPGGQLELSGAPLLTVHDNETEMLNHLEEVKKVSEPLKITWLGLGYHPTARQEDLSWVPKARYSIMRNYLPTRGSRALDMMRRTSTVQANYDYPDETSAMHMLRVSLRLSPFVTAMFANSPFAEGKVTGRRSERALVWLDVDPDRQGLLPGVLASSRGFDSYVEWALKAPMFVVVRDGEYLENTNQTFKQFLEDGRDGHRAMLSDWRTHLNTLFPEVRLKNTLEVRGVDSLPATLACAVPALWTGILYDDRALAQAEAVVESFSYAELQTVREMAGTDGLSGKLPGHKAGLLEVAQQLFEIAKTGLNRRNYLRDGQDETAHLRVLGSLLERGQTPADGLLEQLGGRSKPREIIEVSQI